LIDVRNSAAEIAYEIVLAEEGGDKNRAAQRLGVTKRAVQAWMQGRTGESLEELAG